jgi:acyl dehydratase
VRGPLIRHPDFSRPRVPLAWAAFFPVLKLGYNQPCNLLAESSTEVIRPMTGRYYDELNVDDVIQHSLARTLTETDNILFCSLTLNTQPLHINADYAATTEFGRPIMNGLFTLGLVVGLTVSELTAGTIIANLGYEQVNHPHPMFPGDTLYVATEVIAKRESRSRPEAGIVTLKHTGRNQHGVVCIEVTRSALFLKRPDRP